VFDLIIAGILLISALVGFIRGATREVVAVLAFIAAVVLAIVSLRFSAPIFMGFVAAEWLAKAAALVSVFLVTYIVIRLAALPITRRIHQTSLGAIDRAVGLGFGLVRALVVLGVFNLVFHAATPPERTPGWVLEAKLYPLTAFSADVLKALAPKGSAMFDKVGPVIERNLRDSGDTPPNSAADKAKAKGYDPGDRKALDDLVEKSL